MLCCLVFALGQHNMSVSLRNSIDRRGQGAALTLRVLSLVMDQFSVHSIPLILTCLAKKLISHHKINCDMICCLINKASLWASYNIVIINVPIVLCN